ncbi:MAG: hypothetical protein ACOC2N_03565 [Spirochaetota bacterium]
MRRRSDRPAPVASAATARGPEARTRVRRSVVAARGWVLATLAVLALAACGPPETDPNALRAPDGEPLYRDGTYAASFSHAGPDGWRPFLEIRVRAGLVDDVCFDAVDARGVRLTEDEHFLESHRLDTGVFLPDVIGAFRAGLTETQRVPLSADPAAVEWSVQFEVLAREVLESAAFGVTVDAAGIEQIATAGPYLATDAPDELGWRAELVLVFNGDGIAAAAYREVRTELDGSTRMKRDDQRYQELFGSTIGLDSQLVAATLSDQLLSAGTVEIDGVSGATMSTSRFVALAAKILEHRAPGALPNRLCN